MADLLEVLMEMRNGRVVADCNEKFREVIDAVLDTGLKGELTVKITVTPSKRGMGGAVIEVETEHDCRAKVPELAIGKSRFFVSKERKLSRHDPDQLAIYEGIADREVERERKV